MDNHNEKKTKQIKRILAIITIVFVILIGYFIGRPLVHFVSDPKQFRVWVNDKGIWGVLGFIGMNILQVLLAVIPGGPFEIGAGYAFGVIRGTLICDFAMTTATSFPLYFPLSSAANASPITTCAGKQISLCTYRFPRRIASSRPISNDTARIPWPFNAAVIIRQNA